MNRKSAMEFEFIGYAILVLVVVAVVAAIFVLMTTEKSEQISDISDSLTCTGDDRECVSASQCDPEDRLDLFCGLNQVCCKKS